MDPLNVVGRRDTAEGFNLLRIALIRKIALWSGMPYALQALVLVGFVGLAVLGFGLEAPEGTGSKQFAKLNLVNLTIWGLWWPTMIWTAVWFGRLWCAVCPLEFVANLTERLGRLLGLPQRRLGRTLRSGALILLLYVVIQALVAGIHLHRSPHMTSGFLIALLSMAAAVGFLYRDRAFCRGFCPVGLLLSTYGRGSMLAVRSGGEAGCADCSHHGCVDDTRRHDLDARSCPSLLNPARLAASNDCLLCGQCLKACPPRQSMGLYLRRPFSASAAREAAAAWWPTLFTMVVSGFVAYELCTEWAAAKAVFLAVPHMVGEALGRPHLAGWIKAAWTLVVVPLVLWTLLAIPVRLAGGAGSLPDAWRRLALPMAPIIAGGHMAKGLAKVASWGGYLPMAIRDPRGLESAAAIQAGSLATPEHLVPKVAISVLAVGLVAAMTYLGLRESRLAAPGRHRPLIAPLLIVGALELVLVAGWGLAAYLPF